MDTTGDRPHGRPVLRLVRCVDVALAASARHDRFCGFDVVVIRLRTNYPLQPALATDLELTICDTARPMAKEPAGISDLGHSEFGGVAARFDEDFGSDLPKRLH